MLGLSPRSVIGAFALLAAASACEGDDNDAPAKCSVVIDTWCTSITDCAVSGELIASEDRDESVAECKSGAPSVLDCRRAVGVSVRYDQCLDVLAHPDCDAVNQALTDGTLALPEPCEEVIVLE